MRPLFPRRRSAPSSTRRRVTATQVVKQLPFTLPVIRLEVNASNHLLFFVVIEHLVLSLQFLIMWAWLDVDLKFSKQRAHTLWEEVKLFARLRRSERNAKVRPINSIGPFLTRRVEHTKMGFETVSRHGHYTVDLNRGINHLLPSALADIEEDGFPQRDGNPGDTASGDDNNALDESDSGRHFRTSGILSGLSALTLPPTQWEAAGIPPTAEYYAFAFPLTKLAKLDDYHLSLLSSLLELPDTSADPKAAERADAMRFLILGGFVYFNFSIESRMRVERVNAIRNEPDATAGLSFKCYTPEDLAILPRLRGFLEGAGRYQSPTLRELRDIGVTGFAWLSPGERFPRSPSDPPGADGPETAWCSGGFVYRYDDPAHDRLVRLHASRTLCATPLCMFASLAKGVSHSLDPRLSSQFAVVRSKAAASADAEVATSSHTIPPIDPPMSVDARSAAPGQPLAPRGSPRHGREWAIKALAAWEESARSRGSIVI